MTFRSRHLHSALHPKLIKGKRFCKLFSICPPYFDFRVSKYHHCPCPQQLIWFVLVETVRNIHKLSFTLCCSHNQKRAGGHFKNQGQNLNFLLRLLPWGWILCELFQRCRKNFDHFSVPQAELLQFSSLCPSALIVQ